MKRAFRSHIPWISMAWVGLLALLIILPAALIGQETTGSIAGTITDPSGAVVPGAKIEITGVSLPRPATLSTDNTGNYRAGELPPGTYDVTASAQGFSTAKRTAVLVVLGKISRVDFKMAVGQIAETVTVSAEAVMLDTTSSSTATNLDRAVFDSLPKARSFASVITMAPGARNESKTAGYQVDGASGAENTFYLDGVEVTNIQGGVLGTSASIPIEMVEQVQVKNGVMDAQYGGAMGGVVNAVVRSGSNAFHGQAGFYFNNNAMQARNRPGLRLDPNNDNVLQVPNYPLDSFKTWNPVLDIGGPILKDRLFFFAGYMPTMTYTDRTSVFTDGTNKTFSETFRQNYSVAKLDFVPWARIRSNVSFQWTPQYTKGYLPGQGTVQYPSTSDPTAPWALEGDYNPATTVAGEVDYIATNKLVFAFHGGIKRNNTNSNYGVPNTTAVYYSGSSTTLPPPALQHANGWISQAVGFTSYDVYERKNYSADVAYVFNLHGQHEIKGGWQMNQLSDNVNLLSYPNGYYRYYWGLSYACITTQCSGRQTGTYGYYRYRLYGTYGQASSDNQGMYVQDNWRFNRHININIGLRTEREYLPSFSSAGGAAAPPIEFTWANKISPRIGVAIDPKGNGKQRIYASFGRFYDVMKYEMPRGSFGGDVWKEWYFSLDDPNVVNTNRGTPADPMKLPGKFYEMVNWRIPSNDPSQHLVDPDLKPVSQYMFDFGYEYTLNENMALSARYTGRRLIRTIEDTGFMGANGETYLIVNPGEGITTGAGWTALWLGDTGIPNTTKPIRHYDAIEFRLDKRFSKNYQFVASYSYSRLYGNYSGLASSDENGRDSPNVNRYYDMPWQYADQSGHLAQGLLPTDRPNSVKLLGGYDLKSKLGKTTFAPNIWLASGTPLTTEVAVISSTTAMPYGRGDLGRTPWWHSVDFNIMHEIIPSKSHENLKMRFELSIFNLFNNATVTNVYNTMQHQDDGQIQFLDSSGNPAYSSFFKGWNALTMMKAQGMRTDPEYKLPTSYMGPRNLRLQIAFFF